MKRRAFSLIELLVIVATMAVLGAILFPVAFRRQENPRRRACQDNNLHHIGLGIVQYRNDFDERYPLIFVTSGFSNGAQPYGWADALQPYIKNLQPYQCPSDADEGNNSPTTAGYIDYWYNANFVVRDKKGRPIGAKQDVLGSSAQTVIAGDGGNRNGAPTGDARYNQCGDGTSLSAATQTCPLAPAGLAVLPTAQIHLDGANFVFADGHVKWLEGSSPTQNARVMSNGMTQATIATTANSGKSTFSLLMK
jgi:prepilin-type processing-associated H-X9-DG protein